MTNLVGIYKFVTEEIPDGFIGDILVSVIEDDKIPSGWTKLTSSDTINDFDQDKDIPAIIKVDVSNINILIDLKRTILLPKQLWKPRIECKTYLPKEIVYIRKDEISTRQSGTRTFGVVETFVEWIILTGAELVTK